MLDGSPKTCTFFVSLSPLMWLPHRLVGPMRNSLIAKSGTGSEYSECAPRLALHNLDRLICPHIV